jgi:hypothetical protein
MVCAMAIEQTVADVRPRRIVALAVLQCYVIVAYLIGGIVPYVWRGGPNPPTWLIIVPGLLFGTPGFFITIAGAIAVIPVALAGVAVLTVVNRRALSARLHNWLVAGTVATAALATFMLTPLGHTIQVYILD